MKKSLKYLLLVIFISVILSAIEVLLHTIVPPFGWSIDRYCSTLKYVKCNHLDNMSTEYLYSNAYNEIVSIMAINDDSERRYKVNLPNVINDILIITYDDDATYDNIMYDGNSYKIYQLDSCFDFYTENLLRNIITNRPINNLWSYFIVFLILNLLFMSILFLNQECVSKLKFRILRRSITTLEYKIYGIIGLILVLLIALKAINIL